MCSCDPLDPTCGFVGINSELLGVQDIITMSTITSEEYIQAWKNFHDSYQALRDADIEDPETATKHTTALASSTALSTAGEKWVQSGQTLSNIDQMRVNTYSRVGELARDRFDRRLDAAE